MHFAIAFTLLFSTALATPLHQRERSCNPNFEGVAVSVVHDLRLWTVTKPVAPFSRITPVFVGTEDGPSLSTPAFRFEQTGHVPTSYIIKAIQDTSNSLVVKPGWKPDGPLHLEPFVQSDPQHQTWKVVCDHCGTNAPNVRGPFAYGCRISSDVLGQCIQTPEMHDNKPLFMANCDGSSAQRFDIWTKYE